MGATPSPRCLYSSGIQTWAATAVEDERAAEERYYLAPIVEAPYQNPTESMHAGERSEKDFYIAKIC